MFQSKNCKSNRHANTNPSGRIFSSLTKAAIVLAAPSVSAKTVQAAGNCREWIRLGKSD